MPIQLTVAVLLVLSAVGYWIGRHRALAVADGNVASLHSVPSYYGSFVAVWAGVPAILLVLFFLALKGPVVEGLVLGGMQPDTVVGWARASIPPAEFETLAALAAPTTDALTESQRNLLLINIRNVASGQAAYVNPAVVDFLVPAAEHYRHLDETGRWSLFGVCMALAAGALFRTHRLIAPTFRARNNVEKVVTAGLVVCSVIAVLTTVGIVLSLLFESMRFFARVPVTEFLFGLQWSPQTAIRADQVGSSGAFGAIPLFTGTLLIATTAMLVAGPVGLLSAIYLSEYAHKRVRDMVKPVLEILAGIPTVVYGFFAILTVAPFVRMVGADWLGLDVSSNSALAAGVVMGIMIVPFVSSLSDDVITAVPQAMRDGSYGLGATRSETIVQVILPAALPGIVGAFLLAISRAIGETMIVVMAAGMAANLTFNPLDAVTTVTVQIAALLTGDQEFESAKTLSAFALGLVLFFSTLCLNVIALRVVQKYREKYD